MTSIEQANLIASGAVSAAFFLLACFALVMSLQSFRQRNLAIAVVSGLLLGPIAAIGFIIAAFSSKLPDSVRTRGGGYLGAGADHIFSPSGYILGQVISFAFVATGWAVGKFVLNLSGEPLQGPIIVGLLIGGFLGGMACSVRSRRISFLEVLFITALTSTVVIFGRSLVFELFTYGTAPAYFAVVLVAANLIHLLALVLGGSIGYLFTGDGTFSPSWGYESFIARRFLAGKRGNNVVGIITIISVLAVAVGTTAMIVVMSVMNGFSTDLRSKIFGSNAHLIVMKYGTDFSEHEKSAEKTRGVKGVIGASPFVLNEVMASSDVNLTGALLKGIDVHTIDQVSVLRGNVTRGNLQHLVTPQKIPLVSTKPGQKPTPKTEQKKPSGVKTMPPMVDDSKNKPAGDAPPPDPALDAAIAAAAGLDDQNSQLLPGVVIGKEMARNLKVFVGDVINVVSPVGELGPTGPVPKARAFRVAAIFYSGMYEYDSKFVYIALSEAQSFFSLDKSVTGIEYKVDDVDSVQGIARGVLKELGGYPYRTKDWMEMNRNLFSALKLEKIAMFIILTFIILVASFLITATLIVFVIEKSKEIAILKSMGAADTSIMKVFVVYGVTVGTLGAIVGLVLGVGLCLGIETFGIGLDPDVYYIENLPVHIDGFEVFLVAVSAVFLSYLATIYPALIAARMRPVEGLRFE